MAETLCKTLAACFCGCPLSAVGPRGGRPRSTCSTTCRRRKQTILRAIDRAEAWIVGWERFARNGCVSRSKARVEIARLRADVRELNAELEGRRVVRRVDDPLVTGSALEVRA